MVFLISAFAACVASSLRSSILPSLLCKRPEMVLTPDVNCVSDHHWSCCGSFAEVGFPKDGGCSAGLDANEDSALADGVNLSIRGDGAGVKVALGTETFAVH